jgi:hypothetical protein
MARPVGGYSRDGKKVLGSTSVLKYLQFMDGDILCSWAAKLAREGQDWRKVRSAAGAHGTKLHDLAEFKLPNPLDPVKDRPPNTTDESWEKLQRTYAALREWHLLHNPKVILHEEPLYSAQYNFAGTPDGVAQFPKDIPEYGLLAGDDWLFDWKSGSQIGAKEVCQMASYRQLLAETRGIFVKGALLMHAPTREPGYVRPVALSSEVLDMGWEAFQCGLKISQVADKLAAATEE